MYFGSSERRTAAVGAFMLRKDDHGNLLDEDQPDTLIGLANTMGTGLEGKSSFSRSSTKDAVSLSQQQQKLIDNVKREGEKH